MKLSETAIDRPVFTLVIAICTIVFGAIGFLGMGVDLFPEVEFPVVTIISQLQGASPEVVELTVSQIVEDEVATLQQVESITSLSSFGNSVVVVEFALEKEIDVAVQEVRDRVAAAQRLLPEEMDPPLIQKLNIADQPIMWVAATTDGDYWTLARWVDQVAQDRLQQLPGVGSVLLGAFRNRAYRVWLDPEGLAARGLGPLDVAASIRAQHVERPAGRAEGPERDISIRVFGEFETAEELGGLILTGGESPVRLRDVARVEADLADAQSIARFNGVPTVGMGIRKQSGSNTVEVADRIKAFLPELEAGAPPGVSLRLAFDSSRFIKSSITGVQFDLLFGALLTALVIYLFLRSARATIITCLAIPTSLISTFALMDASNFTMNNLTMLAMSLAVGMVVDDAIVVIENIYRHLEEGLAPFDAARAAMNEIGFPIVVSTISVMAVFLPIAYMKGIIGRFFFQFGLTVSFALFISLVIALTLTPMLSARILARGDERRRMGLLPFWAALLAAAAAVGFAVWRFLHEWQSVALVVAALVVFGLLREPFEPMYERLEREYRRVLGAALRHRALVVIGAVLFFAAGVGLVASPLVAKEFARPADEGRFIVRWESPLGTSLDATDRLTRLVEERILSHPEIDGAFVATGFGGGGAPQPNVGLSFINMKSRHEREKSQDEIMNALRGELAQIPGLIVFVDRITPIGGGQRTTDLQYVLKGPDLEKLAEFADRILGRMRDAGGFQDIDSNLDLQKPEARVHIDRERAELLGVTAAEITDAINMMMGGSDVAYFKEGGDRYTIRVRARRDRNTEPSDIGRILVRARDGRIVELSNVVRVEEGIGPNVINRFNRQRAATIFANLSGKPLAEALAQFEGFLKETLPPDGLYTAEIAGSSKTFRDAFRYLLQALVLSVLVVYLLLAAQFESFLHPFTIMMTLPLAATGVFLALAITGLSLDVFSFIGIVMLVGIVTKNGILLVDFANHLRRAGRPRDEAVLEAGPIRLRPVLMTAATTIIGMVPVAIGYSEGGATRASMGWAVVGGMFTSTPLTLIVIPVVYTLMDDLVTWGRARAFFGRSRGPEES
jgi:multidrug efflux pump subunit AcrB